MVLGVLLWFGLGQFSFRPQGGLLLAQYLIEVSMIVVVALIVRYAWKWPKREACEIVTFGSPYQKLRKVEAKLKLFENLVTLQNEV